MSLDDLLIDRVFQPLADAMADHLGLERRRAACLCIDLATIGWILSQARVLSDAVLAWDGGPAVMRLSVLLLGLMALSGLRVVFRRQSVRANPLRAVMRPHRAVVLLMLVARLAQLGAGAFSELADLAMLAFAIMALYLGACTARPPVQRRAGALHQAV